MWLLGSCSTDDPNQPTEWRCNSPIACLRCDTHTSFSPRCNLVWGIASFASQRVPYARPHTDPASSLHSLFFPISVPFGPSPFFQFFIAPLDRKGALPRSSATTRCGGVGHPSMQSWWRCSLAWDRPLRRCSSNRHAVRRPCTARRPHRQRSVCVPQCLCPARCMQSKAMGDPLRGA